MVHNDNLHTPWQSNVIKHNKYSKNSFVSATKTSAIRLVRYLMFHEHYVSFKHIRNFPVTPLLLTFTKLSFISNSTCCYKYRAHFQNIIFARTLIIGVTKQSWLWNTKDSCRYVFNFSFIWRRATLDGKNCYITHFNIEQMHGFWMVYGYSSISEVRVYRYFFSILVGIHISEFYCIIYWVMKFAKEHQPLLFSIIGPFRVNSQEVVR